MGRLRVQLAVSADWYIAPVDRSYGWLDPYPAEEFGFMKFIASIRAIVMGRTSYDEMKKMGPSPFDEMPTFVLTSRPLEGTAKPVTLDALPAAMAAVDGDVWLFGGGQ